MRHLGLGVTGQACTFIAMVLPVAMRQAAQVLTLIYASSITILLVYVALLAYPNVYPVVRGPRTAAVATRLTRRALAVTALAVLPLTLVEDRLNVARGTFGATALLLLGQGTYLIELTQLVRAGDVRRIGLARLVYGTSQLLLTLVACLAPLGPLAVTVSNALAYLVSWWPMHRWVAGSATARPNFNRRADRRLARAYLRRTGRPTVSMAVGGWTGFLPGLALPGLGSAAAPWAVVTRICGGFATLQSTIVVPPLEARLSRAIRDRDQGSFARARRTALLSGAGVAVVAVLTGLVFGVYVTGIHAAEEWFLPLALATALFWGSSLVGFTVSPLPNFLGRDGARLAWEAGRAVLMTIAWLSSNGVTRLVVMGSALTVSTVWLLPLTRYRGHGTTVPADPAHMGEQFVEAVR